jgi:hypothetical protein
MSVLVYIVMARSGEYESTWTWPVAAYSTPEKVTASPKAARLAAKYGVDAEDFVCDRDETSFYVRKEPCPLNEWPAPAPPVQS